MTMNKSKYNKDVDPVRNHKWEEGNVDLVTLPEETYGECKKSRCHNVGELGNGVCQECWDKGSEGKSRIRKEKLDLPIIIIS